MVCGLETREAILDKAQQWMKFSHSASRNGIAPFAQRLLADPSHSDSEVLWGIAASPSRVACPAHRDPSRAVADSVTKVR